MDLKQYFRKLKETEATISDEYPLVVSVETEDGGKPGTVTEVSRQEAAKTIVENRGILANAEQRQAYFEREANRKLMADKAELSRRLQIAIISDSEVRTTVSKQEKEEERKGSR